MALLSDIYNTAMGRPSFRTNINNPGLNNLNRFNTPLNKPMPGMQKPVNQGPAPIDFRKGVYKDQSRFDSNFRYRMSQQVKLSRPEARHEVARILHQSSGGDGIGKGEFVGELNWAVKQGWLKQHEADAARTQFHAW